MDMLALNRSATARMAEQVSALSVDDLDRETPCAGWTIRNVLAHLIGGNRLFADVVTLGAGNWAARDKTPVTWPVADEYRHSAESVGAAFAAVAPDRLVELVVGPVPASSAVAVHFADHVVHSWDLAVALGHDATLPDGLAKPALAILNTYPPEVRDNPDYFTAAREPAEATPTADLIAATGRDYLWKAGAIGSRAVG